MKAEVAWLNDALATKDIAREMTHYRMGEGFIRATNGRLSAGHPWDSWMNEYLVPGSELNKVLDRMPKEPVVVFEEAKLKLRCGRFSGTIQTLEVEDAYFPEQPTEWLPLPDELIDTLRSLRPFVSDNASQPWALCVALREGWCYATTNVVVAGAPAPWTVGMDALLPAYAVDFVLAREEGVKEWSWGAGFVAFRWEDGSWMHALLMEGSFPSKIAELVQEAWYAECLYEIDDDFRAAYNRVAGMVEGGVYLDRTTISGVYKRASVEEEFDFPWDWSDKKSIWTPLYLDDVIKHATSWDPTCWPNPAPFRGDGIAGLVIGRTH